MIPLAKRGDLHARRQVLALLLMKKGASLFDNVAQSMRKNGGYTRILKMGPEEGTELKLLCELV